MTPERVVVTIEELVVDEGADVEAALRAALADEPVDAGPVAAAVAAAVEADGARA